MIYALMRAVARIALRWFYRDIHVEGAERVPASGPLLVAINHPNALVDVMVAGTSLPRRLTLTAKATLSDHPVIGALFRILGVVPLRRASDESARGGGDAVSRNEDAFAALLDALAAGHAVLIFPEGRSHSEPAVAPLRTGLARVALQARAERGLARLTIVPVGLVFERKWEPRSRVLVQVGVPLPMDEWQGGVAELTAEVDARLRAVTLNFDSDDAARQATDVARSLTAMSGGVRDLATPDAPLGDWLDVARRADRVRAALDSSGTGTPPRARLLLERLGALDARVGELGLALGDVGVSPALPPGMWFAVRELAILVVTGPVAAWGRLNHWAPLRLTRTLALRSSRNPDDPAMRTMVAGLLLVLLFYAVQTTIVGLLAGPWWALLYLASLPASASWDLTYGDRMRRARQRVRAWRVFRRDPLLQQRLRDETRWLRDEARVIERGALGPRRVVDEAADGAARD